MAVHSGSIVETIDQCEEPLLRAREAMVAATLFVRSTVMKKVREGLAYNCQLDARESW